MVLISNRYGKARVRVLRLTRDGDRHEPRELEIDVALEGDFAAAYVAADNRASVATDTMKNLIHVVARERPDAGTETFLTALADRFLAAYPQAETVSLEARETRWVRMAFDGVEHGHAFTQDGNGHGVASLVATREGATLWSGVEGVAILKTTQSGWADFFRDAYTTLPPTTDRLLATRLDARWRWTAAPERPETVNAAILDALLRVFATTYSASVQDSLYRMGEAALAAAPEIDRLRLACPNKHYIPLDLSRFGLANDGVAFLPTDEPHGQIECVVGREA